MKASDLFVKCLENERVRCLFGLFIPIRHEQRAAFTAIVFNDNDYGRITNPDFKAYAESFGIRGYRPRTLGGLKAQLREALNRGKRAVVEIPVDPSANDRLAWGPAGPQRSRARHGRPSAIPA